MGLLRRFGLDGSDTSDSDDERDQQNLDRNAAGASKALRKIVKNSGKPGVATSGAGALGAADRIRHSAQETSWIKRLIPQLEEETAEEQFGNYVIIDRRTGEKVFESMPIYVRIGMNFLYRGAGDQLLGFSYIRNQLHKQSVKQGKLFDQEEDALEHIQAFVKTYRLESSLAELAEPDLSKYKTFNSFFYRALAPGARPAAQPEDPRVVVSSADCRLTVWEDVDTAKEFWIKGRNFTVPHLLQDETLSSHSLFANGCSLAIFRLAPADYHRWHSPLAGTYGVTKAIPGALFTVNPTAVRNPDVDVFTANKRDITLLSVPSLNAGESPTPIPIIAIGAMLVGSIAHTRKQGDNIAKGEELGYFAYGGSTVIVLFPKGFLHFDNDLVQSSKAGLETQVRVGEQIGVRA